MRPDTISCQDLDWFIATRCDVARSTHEQALREGAYDLVEQSFTDPQAHPRRTAAEYVAAARRTAVPAA
ncbi:hypothetical protein [Motilibacter aurantiacus]|uniref:hypothetical protein n=1 Tax=Motilibacter aurantiacus TaxID=2714955 RepID=UPI00140AEDF6|nr:hypothetical protein [Motilibacter aurantiacus]NHC46168.1 hypothetical protein [Motilibacter aurantiacus]